MKGRLYLINWDAPEAATLANDLRAEGWHVDVESEDAARAVQSISAQPPSATVISLAQHPSFGIEVGRTLREQEATASVPVLFLDGDEQTKAQAKGEVPRVLFLTSAELLKMLHRITSMPSSPDVTFAYRIKLHEYDPSWPDRFEEEKARVQATLGEWAPQIEHVGSTSVPGLTSKAIVDLLVGVPSFDQAALCVDPLQKLGYLYRDDLASLLPNRLFFERSTETDLRYHVLVVGHGDYYWQRYVLFRDYLRAYPDEAQRYADLKKHLASEHGGARHEYSESKAEYVAQVLEKARAEWGDG
jgi:GrpB-like predicted nucleotidyltransferase (UPF0157 family)